MTTNCFFLSDLRDMAALATAFKGIRIEREGWMYYEIIGQRQMRTQLNLVSKTPFLLGCDVM